MKIGGDGDPEHMQKCLGELLDEENENLLVTTTMADIENNSDTPFTKVPGPVSDDQGKSNRNNLYFFFFLLHTRLNYNIKLTSDTTMYV